MRRWARQRRLLGTNDDDCRRNDCGKKCADFASHSRPPSAAPAFRRLQAWQIVCRSAGGRGAGPHPRVCSRGHAGSWAGRECSELAAAGRGGSRGPRLFHRHREVERRGVLDHVGMKVRLRDSRCDADRCRARYRYARSPNRQCPLALIPSSSLNPVTVAGIWVGNFSSSLPR